MADKTCSQWLFLFASPRSKVGCKTWELHIMDLGEEHFLDDYRQEGQRTVI